MSTTPSKLGAGQVLQGAFDDATQALRTVSNVTAIVSGEQMVSIESTDDSVAIGDSSGNLATTTLVSAKRGLDVNVINSSSTTAALVKAANDLVKSFTWSDFGTSNQRVATIVYTSASVGSTVTETFAYTLVVSSYRLDSITRVVS